jgi:hypothetical protein
VDGKSRCTVVALAVFGTVALGGCGSTPESPEVVIPAGTPAFCEAVRANLAATRPLSALSAKGPAPHPAAEVAAAIEPLRASNQAMRDAAPADLGADAEQVYQVAELQLAVYERTGGDAAAVSADPEYTAKSNESAAATQRVRQYVRDFCG